MSIINAANYIDRAENRYLDWMAGLGRNSDRAAGFIRNRINHRPPFRATSLQIASSVATNIFGSVMLGASLPFTFPAAVTTLFTRAPVEPTAVIAEPIAVAEVEAVDNHSEAETEEEGLSKMNALFFQFPI